MDGEIRPQLETVLHNTAAAVAGPGADFCQIGFMRLDRRQCCNDNAHMQICLP